MLALDPEIGAALADLAKKGDTLPALPRGDWKSRRQLLNTTYSGMALPESITGQVDVEEFTIAVPDGNQIDLRLYRMRGTSPTAALVYTHGGGKIALDLDNYDPICRYYAAEAGVAVLAIGFRMAPEFPFPTPVEDCYTGLVWLSEHAHELGINPQAIGIAGDSGGGSFAAGVALMARDRNGPSLARQFLFYPMLDDRTVEPDPLLEQFAVWSYDDNWTGWTCFLDTARGSEDVSPYAAPPRATDLTGLPPAYIDVGELDIFRDESISYANRLCAAGISIELHVYPGAPHAFEIIAPDSALAKKLWLNRIHAVRGLNSATAP